MGREPQIGFPFKMIMEFGKPFRPLCCGSVWRDAVEVGPRAIGRVSLLIILLKRIRHFECSAVYVGILIYVLS